MAVITIAPVAAGVTSSKELNDGLYSDDTTSAAALNGSLDSANLDPATPLTSDHVREQALANGTMVGSTGLLDYTKASFEAGALGDDGAHRAIPGANMEFFLPYNASLVIFTWNIQLTNSIEVGAGADAQLIFSIDGAKESPHKRKIRAERHSGSAPITGFRYECRATRYSGHAIRTGMTKGFHSAGLSCYAEEDTLRVRCRNMKVIWFK
tara:strand:+ start:1124 stop:1753 length:630 start_codon:yes stop_codon:yes gene_type:complete